MHRWLLNLLGDEFSGRLYAPDDGAGSAAGDGGGASPAASSPEPAPAASPSPDSGSSTPSSAPDGGAAPPRTPVKSVIAGAKDTTDKDPFEFMDYGDEGPVVVDEPEPVQAAAPAPDAAPVAPQPAPAPVAPTPTPSPQGSPQAADSAPSLPTDPGEVLELMRPQFAQMVEHAAEQYKLSKEEADALETDVVGTLPKLLAKVHMQAALGTLHNLQKFVPEMIKKGIEGYNTREKNLAAFFQSNPGLDQNNPAHLETFSRIGTAYRRANPEASREQAIKDIGMMTLQALGLPLAPPPARGNGRTVSQQPFVPAGTGASPATPPPAHPYDPFAGMGMDFDE